MRTALSSGCPQHAWASFLTCARVVHPIVYPKMEARRLWIPGEMPAMNDIVDWSKKVHRVGKLRINRWQGTHKPKNEQRIALFARQQGFLGGAGHWTFLHLQPHRRRDPDNITAGAHKVIFDALVNDKRLKNDGWAHILGIRDYWRVDPDRVGVVVLLTQRPLSEEEAWTIEEKHGKQRAKNSRRVQHHAPAKGALGEAEPGGAGARDVLPEQRGSREYGEVSDPPYFSGE